MSQPGLNIFFEVELLEWVQLTSASGHDVTVSGDGVGHVEVVYVFHQWSSVQLSLAVWLVGEAFEA